MGICGLDMFAFRGMSEVSLDEKGRLAVPVRYREVLTGSRGGQMVVTQSPNRECGLWLYPLAAWEEIEPELARLSDFQEGSRLIKQMVWGAARECRLDKNGRILVPGELRRRAGLNRRVCLVGTGHRFNLFDPLKWDGLLARVEELEADGALADTLGSLAL